MDNSLTSFTSLGELLIALGAVVFAIMRSSPIVSSSAMTAMQKQFSILQEELADARAQVSALKSDLRDLHEENKRLRADRDWWQLRWQAAEQERGKA